ncbi:MAG: AAA family ATPase [Chloroflexota bacterium]|nr:AAA family ATPase [Chloroflexota bacterium]
MDSSQAYEIALQALGKLATQRATFPFDAIWKLADEDVPPLLRPTQANRLIRNGYIERTGRAIRAESGSRPGSRTAEYKLGIRFRQNLQASETPAFPKLEGLHITNYRVLRDVLIEQITPLAAFVGPNGSGKSTIFDVLSFLSECFTVGLRRAWEERGGFHELRSKGNDTDPITITVIYRDQLETQMTYRLAINGDSNYDPFIEEELLTEYGNTQPLLEFHEGAGEYQDEQAPTGRSSEAFQGPDILAVRSLGQFSRLPRITALYQFLTDWYLASVKTDRIRSGAEFGPVAQLSGSGDNLAQVIQYMQQHEPEQLQQVVDKLSQWIPRLAGIEIEQSAEGRLLLQLRDTPFKEPILAQFASEGTLKMLAYLTLFYSSHAPQLIGLEEPENFVSPRLLGELAETCRMVTDQPQLLVTTHSPFFVNALQPEEVWVLSRGTDGYTQVQRAADIPGIPQFMAHGAQLGDLWMEGYFRPSQALLEAYNQVKLADSEQAEN